jgi:rhamnosyltransferase
VTFHPDLEVLKRQLARLPSDAHRVVVDNASDEETRAAMRRMAVDAGGFTLIENGENAGLAAALNTGIRFLASTCAERRYVLLLDQDTEPDEGAVERLLAGFVGLRERDTALGCVGPDMVDVATGLSHGFHRVSTFGWGRRMPATGEITPIAADNLNGSGTLAEVALFDTLGGLDERLFIDHVDTEWSFRVRSSGRSLYGFPGAVFRQRMGLGTWRFWFFGWRVWPYRSPARHRFLFRNTLWLMRLPHVWTVWKLLAPVKLALTLLVHALFDRARGEQVRNMCRGLREGLAGPPSRPPPG